LKIDVAKLIIKFYPVAKVSQIYRWDISIWATL